MSPRRTCPPVSFTGVFSFGSRNHKTSIGAPRSFFGKPALSRRIELRPSAAIVSRALTSSPSLSFTPATRPPLEQQVDHFGLHPQRKAGIAPRLVREEIEELPLRHQRDEAALDRQMAGVGEGDLAVGNARGERAHLVVGALQEFVDAARARAAAPGSRDEPCRRGNRGRNRHAFPAPAPCSRRGRTAAPPSLPRARRRRSPGPDLTSWRRLYRRSPRKGQRAWTWMANSALRGSAMRW